jgi:hypothetical protein
MGLYGARFGGYSLRRRLADILFLLLDAEGVNGGLRFLFRCASYSAYRRFGFLGPINLYLNQ